MLNQKFQKNIKIKRENGNEKLFDLIHRIQKMSRLTLVRYSSNYYINIFAPSQSFHKIFNKKSVKISYSCMRSMSSIISAHNCSTLNPPKTSFGCNCRNRSMCPLQNKCLTPNIVYQADITNNVDDERRVYLGLSETPFKDRFRNHVRDFNNEIHYNKTEFFKYVWDLKRNSKEPHIR